MVQCTRNFQDVRAVAATRPKQREGRPRASAATRRESRRFQREFSGHSTRQRRHPPKTRRGSSIPETIFQDAPLATAAMRPNQLISLRFPREFAGRSTRQRCHPPKKARNSSIPSRVLRTLHAPPPPRCQNSERVIDFKQNLQDAPRASATTRPKQREGSRFQTELGILALLQLVRKVM